MFNLADLKNNNGKKINEEDIKSKKYLGLYFSANWCKPCKNFTPKLIDYYNNLLDKNYIEIVFISLDSSEEEFTKYFSSQPWYSLPYNLQDVKDTVLSTYGIVSVPTLLILDIENNYKVITKNGVNNVLANKPF